MNYNESFYYLWDLWMRGKSLLEIKEKIKEELREEIDIPSTESFSSPFFPRVTLEEMAYVLTERQEKKNENNLTE